jgi:hypothetical protein
LLTTKAKAMAKYKMRTFMKQFSRNDKQKFNCGAIVFRNVGDMRAKINDVWTLDPGDETPTISTGHPDVIDETEYKVTFTNDIGGTISLVNAIYTQTLPVTVGTGKQTPCDKL